MRLTSGAFSDGSKIPRRFTCDGEDLSPPLEWSDAPAATRSFALFCDDPDAPAGTWHHWAAYDIAGNEAGLPPGAGRHAQKHGFKQAMNDFGHANYGGPCPPHRHGPHHYHFRLIALSVENLPLREDASCQDVAREARSHALAEATLVGVYER